MHLYTYISTCVRITRVARAAHIHVPVGGHPVTGVPGHMAQTLPPRNPMGGPHGPPGWPALEGRAPCEASPPSPMHLHRGRSRDCMGREVPGPGLGLYIGCPGPGLAHAHPRLARAHAPCPTHARPPICFSLSSCSVGSIGGVQGRWRPPAFPMASRGLPWSRVVSLGLPYRSLGADLESVACGLTGPLVVCRGVPWSPVVKAV